MQKVKKEKKQEKKKEKEIDTNVQVYSVDGKKLDKLQLDKNIFGSKVNEFVVHESILMYLANKRSGTHSTKTRSDVSGGGVKPWRQKGTGRARSSSIRNPLWKGGGKIFGPHPRDYSYKIPKKMRAEALRNSVNAKLQEENLILVEDIKVDQPKTKKMRAILDKLGAKTSSMLVVGVMDKNTALASRNLEAVDLKLASDLNTYDIMSHDKLIVTKDALKQLEKRMLR